MANTYLEFVPIIKAISDETRLKIIDILSCGEMCACDILEFLHITQSTLSYHMKILTESGLINGVKDGSWMRYSINKEKSEALLSFLGKVTESKLECICKSINLNIRDHC
ncbi:MAG: metalloregulator ArsR/SmtB family transcription factor [Bacilli bacterium]